MARNNTLMSFTYLSLMIALYIATKFCLYCAWCGILARLFKVRSDNGWIFAVNWGAARFAIGLAVGLPIGALYLGLQNAALPNAASYLLAFGPIRLAEWGLLWWLIARRYPVPWGSKALWWIAGGAVLSMACDGLALAAGADQLKFVC